MLIKKSSGVKNGEKKCGLCGKSMKLWHDTNHLSYGAQNKSATGTFYRPE